LPAASSYQTTTNEKGTKKEVQHYCILKKLNAKVSQALDIM